MWLEVGKPPVDSLPRSAASRDRPSEHDASEGAPPSDVWRQLAERKLPEVKWTLTEARAIKEILETGLRCQCLSLEDCLGLVDDAYGHSPV